MTTRSAAQRKYGAAFTFRNTALHLFPRTRRRRSARCRRRPRSGSPVPVPAHLPRSRRPDVGDRTAHRATGHPGPTRRGTTPVRSRGGYADNDGSRAAALEFARRSDRVRLFLFETCDETDTGFVDKARLFSAFEVWVKANGHNALGKTRATRPSRPPATASRSGTACAGSLASSCAPNRSGATRPRVQKVQSSLSPASRERK